MTFFIALIGMGLPVNITRNFFNKSREDLAKIIANLVIILSSITLLALLLIFFYSYFFDSFLEIPERWLFALPVISFMSILNKFNLIILRNQKKPLQYGFIEISKTAINLFLTILLIIGLSFDWEGRLWGILIAEIIFGLIGIYYLIVSGFFNFHFDLGITKEVLVIALPLVFHSLSTVLLSLGDRIFLDRMLGKDVVGLYTIGYQFGMTLLIVVGAFNKSWSPWMYEKLVDISEASKKKIVKYTYLYNIFIIITAICITLLSYFLIIFMTTEEYYSSKMFIIWVSLGYAFWGMYTMIFPYFVHTGKTHFLGLITVFTGVINLFLNYFLITLNGAVGAAQATLASYFILFLLVWWYSNKIFPMPWFSFLRSDFYERVSSNG